MTPTEPKQKGRREYQKHGDNSRQRALRERGLDAIDGRTRAGRRAEEWRGDAIKKKGGKSCVTGMREKIDGGAFYLWRALELRSFIMADARKRGTPINRRTRKLPLLNDQHDVLFEQWCRIHDELELDKPIDLARRLQLLQEEAARRQDGGTAK